MIIIANSLLTKRFWDYIIRVSVFASLFAESCKMYCFMWDSIFHRLITTISFPEFTSRVCPARCKIVRTCGQTVKQPLSGSTHTKWFITDSMVCITSPTSALTWPQRNRPAALTVSFSPGASKPRDINVKGRDTKGIWFAAGSAAGQWVNLKEHLYQRKSSPLALSWCRVQPVFRTTRTWEKTQNPQNPGSSGFWGFYTYLLKTPISN